MPLDYPIPPGTHLHLGPNNKYIHGPYEADFEEKVGKTHFFGRPAASGTIWRAKGVCFLHLTALSTLNSLQEYIQKAIVDNGQTLIANYQQPNLPDPSYVLTLPNDVYTNSNLYAVQKSYDGPFQFDVFFESASAKHKLTCVSSLVLHSNRC